MFRTVAVAFTLLLGTLGFMETKGEVRDQTVTETEQTVTIQTLPTSPDRVNKNSVTHPILRQQMKTKRVPSIYFWYDVAWCETHQDWKNGGYYAGGMGIALSTWQGYGGHQFAKTPDKATIEEQIVVANRIGFLGFQTKNVYMTFADKQNNKPHFRPAAGVKKWGGVCAKYSDHRLKKKP